MRAAALLRNGIHLAVLSGLGVTQPVLDILGRNPAFFVVRGSSDMEIVLFALILTFGPAVVLTTVELAVGLLSRSLAEALHLLFVGALSALLALYLVTRLDLLDGAVAIAGAATAGAAAAFLYARAPTARFVLTVLAPAPVLLVALFLFSSPVSKLVGADAPAVRAAPVDARTPVVFIAFDEFNTTSLMNERQQIDAGRFPNFAALARGSNWYRDATTVYWLSEVAIPSILSGLNPDPKKLPVASEYPRNLFTLLGGSYRLVVLESLTRLCPPSLCREVPAAETQVVAGEAGSLASDAGIVYLHLVLPDRYVERVPPIDDSWGNFGRGEPEEEEAVQRARAGKVKACARNVCRFSELLSSRREPTLYFLDTLLPHVPYVYLPSGRRYAVDARILRGIDNGLWLESWPALQGQQRYLLQLGYTDSALGVLLQRLRETGLFDRALVIVTADHGVGFGLRDQRRLPTPTNLHEIAFVPLFVKLPGQQRGRTVDGLVRTIDILPTIARVLGVPLDWRIDGRPLVGRRLPEDGTVAVMKQNGSLVSQQLSVLRERRARAVRERIAEFGTGSFASIYEIGPHRELVGRTPASLPVSPSGSLAVRIDGATLLDAVDKGSGFVPSFIEGSVEGTSGTMDLAVALNGRIAAVTKTFDQHGQTRFSALVSEEAFRGGRNAIEVFAVEGTNGSVRLARLRGSDVTFSLLNGGTAVQAGTNKVALSRALQGVVRAKREATGWVFSGFAAQRGTTKHVDTLVVFVGTRAVYSGRAENLKPHAILGEPELGKTGFEFELPA
ncbi:MAG TPA: sulfatase-like hydrolase/transferase, partial [Gaiellaceae bacterium]|nr:sulfatase-like hydrolase/transferase [Gaiellaceae bacterium]